MATGGKNPTDAVVLRLPDYRPVATLTVGAPHCARCAGRHGRHTCVNSAPLLHALPLRTAAASIAARSPPAAFCCWTTPCENTLISTPTTFPPWQGHLDWVFGSAWVSDRHLVTGSRDGALALWDIPEPSAGSAGGQEGQPAVVRKCYEDKKDMKRKFKVGAGALALAW